MSPHQQIRSMIMDNFVAQNQPKTEPKKKIIVKKGIKMGATIGAFMYAYYIDFHGNYSYTFEATEEGMMNVISIFKEAGYEVVEEDIKRSNG